MFKAIKILVLLAILVIGAIAVYVYVLDKPAKSGANTPQLTTPDEGRPLVSPEEKVGVTTETVNP